jgi:hypothetical protein
MIKSNTSFKSWNIISRAVEEGINFGVNHAFKHSNTPSLDTIKENVEREVMNSLCEIFDFDDKETN